MKKLLSLLLLFLFFPPHVIYAQNSRSELPAITIINPLRGVELGHDKTDLARSLQSQWELTKEVGINATWLWQFTALENESMVTYAKSRMQGQKFGLWLEIDRNHATKSHVPYRGQGPWYFSDGLMLVSYDIPERKKIIDSAFEMFRKKFGYYPRTVGSWWIGADSLVYMQKKYGIVAALKAADQYHLDMYSIWGAPWSISYLPSTRHQAIPANTFDESAKVVVLQWAARDPVRGYSDPLYSVQDFPARELDFSYVNYLTSIFLKHPTDTMVFGLENGGDKKSFEKYYKKIILKAKELENSRKVKIMFAEDYANDFLNTKQIFAGTRYFLAKDYVTDDQVFWFHSSSYRVGIRRTEEGVILFDLQNYKNKLFEDFGVLPNSQAILQVKAPEIIDTMRFPEKKVLITKNAASLRILKNTDTVELLSGSKKIASFGDEEMIFFYDDDLKNQMSIQLVQTPQRMNMPLIVFFVFLIAYVVVVLLQRLHTKHFLIQITLIFFLALLAIQQYLNFPLESDTFLLERKMVFLLSYFGHPWMLSTDVFSFILMLPLVILLLLHVFLFVYKKHSIGSYILIFLVLLLYMRLPYFPLDRSTLLPVIGYFVLSGIVILFLGVMLWKKKMIKTYVFSYLFLSFASIAIIAIGVVISRTSYALTPFEMQALRLVQEKNKNVLFVTQEGGTKPIYKAVRPALYENTNLAERFTGRKWTTIVRPSDHVLRIKNYENTLIVVPHYLGADLSPYEMKKLDLRKIFDNAHIRIYEKRG